MRKRMTAGFMGILMILMTVFTCFVPGMQVQAAGKTLIVHYGGRADDNYEGWNLWLWEEGKDGQQVDFTDTDDYGQVAVYQTNRTPASIGFIVRLNQWEDKDIADDRFVTMDGDTVEMRYGLPAGKQNMPHRLLMVQPLMICRHWKKPDCTYMKKQMLLSLISTIIILHRATAKIL